MSAERNQLTVEPGAIISPEAKLSGKITVGKGTVIHPKSIILAEVRVNSSKSLIHRFKFLVLLLTVAQFL